jgi:uncharacterized protein YdeI (YjbR/CyaY-like superfamily)
MDDRETRCLHSPEELRQWLQENYQTKIEIRLIFYRKSSGKRTLTIHQAVEECLCFGWIQSRLKPIWPDEFAVRFSPRRKGSTWSTPNLKRMRKPIIQGKMTEAGWAVLSPDFYTESRG